MADNNISRINVSKAFKEAWKGFKGWWIPLCIVSSILLFSQSWLPKAVMENFPEFEVFDEYKREYKNYNRLLDAGYSPKAAREFLFNRVKNISSKPETLESFQMLFFKMFILFGIVVFLVSILNVLIILMSKFSVSTDKGNIKDYTGKPFKLTPSYLLLTIIKLIPFMFFILPGFYFYVKLYFTGFIITEASANPFSAMKKSWKMTNGIFWQIFFIFIITLVIDIISGITVIGFIPGNSFKYTLRASLYKQALGE